MSKRPFKDDIAEQDLFDLGINQIGYTKTSKIVFSEDVRAICEKNQCGNYGRSWTCPPAVGTLDECIARIMKYEDVLVYSVVTELEDSFDFEGMQRGSDRFVKITEQLFGMLEKPYLLLSSAACGRCSACNYPNPCRFPEKLSPAVESYGIYVYKIAETAGIPYRLRPNTVSYFGIVCY